ncbi:MerR family transcriptional regulator [Novosphingobium sp.]|uniref:MerR family transcriptional regulator n=1 Tax=Novosphingobium sp. TaxID=1874826 RepID=UPI0027365639|nr:MerR family transcriptional regulator [Novosphingobium sp.]MDP3906866.1 MerR family transcriptional regulator [Novosphingobium sp.]
MSQSAPATAFADGKDAGALRTIGEVAHALGIRQHVLRYWEEQFPMLQPLKRSGGRRYYRPEDVQLVETIDRLVHHQGYTLKGALKALREGDDSASVPMAVVSVPPAAPTPPSFAFRARLIALRTTLVNALHEG